MATSPSDRTVVIFGVGLIGGSFALGLKAAGAATRIIGLGRNPANLRRALKLGVIDEVARDPEIGRAHV